jgi:hypothetical protein
MDLDAGWLALSGCVRTPLESNGPYFVVSEG